MVLSKMFAANFLEYTLTAADTTSLGESLEAQRPLDHYTGED